MKLSSTQVPKRAGLGAQPACPSFPGALDRRLVARVGSRCPPARRTVRAAQAVAVEVNDVVTSAPPQVSVTRPLWSAPSGQNPSPLHSAPVSGRAEPLGATPDPSTGGVNFAVVSNNAISVKLVLFTEDDLKAGRSSEEIELDPIRNRTGNVWHIMLPGIRAGLLYGYRVSGFHQSDNQIESKGLRFDASKVVLDPYAKAVISRRQYGQLGPELPYGVNGTLGAANTWPQHAACVPPVEADDFDWQGDSPLNLPMEQLVIYEMHVRGFTRHQSSGTKAPGTYQGMVERLDYLKRLGVNAVELLPMQEFNELEYYMPIPGSETGAHRFNYWGYSTVGFFAPMSRFSHAIARGEGQKGLSHEFKTLVREAHKRGIEVILDVVFNHTAEGNEQGLTLSFRGLDNRMYYMMAPGGEYYNYSGCGNTFNCNHPVVRQFILDCLRYWVTEYHVDGFRFDLASILTRAPSAWHPQQFDETGKRVPLQAGQSAAAIDAAGAMTDGMGVPTGTPLADPPLIEMISEDPVLRNTKLIAEAWDCDGLNQVGAFPHYGGRWSEWNGKFRDVVRNFIKGSEGPWAGAFAGAICGSGNVYADTNPPETDWWATNAGRKWRGSRGPTASINFVTAHDGFTLADLVAYNEKHNDANGEGNRDGEQHNNSWNCGEEGEATKFITKRLRQRQMRNMMMALLLSHGVPMVHMGDEYGHSKGGNNNTYCHDSDLNWFNWEQLRQDEGGLARFMRLLINFRRSRPELLRTTYVNGNDIQWHGEQAHQPDWSDASRLVAYSLPGVEGAGIYVAFNTSHLPKVLVLPAWPGRVWQLLVDTSKTAPFDFLVADEELSAEDVARARAAASQWTAQGAVSMLPWSSVVLESVPEDASHTLRAQPGTSAINMASGAPDAVQWDMVQVAGAPTQPIPSKTPSVQPPSNGVPQF